MIGNFLKSLIDKGYTQVQLSKIIEVSQPQISDYLRDKSDPSLEKLINIANKFNVSIDYIIGRTNNPELH